MKKLKYVKLFENLENEDDPENIYALLDAGMVDSSEAVELLISSGQLNATNCASIGVFKESPGEEEADSGRSYYGHVKFNGTTHGINLDVLPGYAFEDVLVEAFKICSQVGAKYAYRKVSLFTGIVYDMKPEGSSSFSRTIKIRSIPALIKVHDLLGIKTSQQWW
jgi:hypothetical protein